MNKFRQRVRIRFSKEGDLRLISHRDLARAFERLFRRSGLRLSMSEGFHPKAKISFPSALGLGINGTDELLEVELAEAVEEESISALLRPLAPPGLSIHSVSILDDGAGKAQVAASVYEISLPRERREAARRAIDWLMAQESAPVAREGGKPTTVDIHDCLESLQLDGGVLRMRLLASRTASARPRDVLAALDLADLETAGCWLTRTAVEIAS